MPETRIDVLRRKVIAQGGVWTADRAADAVTGIPGTPAAQASVGRALCKDLAAEGLLVRDGGKSTWFLTAQAEERHATAPVTLAQYEIEGSNRPLDVLRRAVVMEGGEWTAQRAIEVLEPAYSPRMREDGTIGQVKPTLHRGRDELNRLVTEGLLVMHGKLGRLWTLTERAEQLRRSLT